MEYNVIGDDIILRLNRGEEIIKSITLICENENIKLGTLSGIGAAGYAVVGLYKVSDKKYYKNIFEKEMEITSLCGNITTKDNKVYLHIHASFADDSGNVIGGHLNEAVISATCEIFIRKMGGEINRIMDDDIGLNILDI